MKYLIEYALSLLNTPYLWAGKNHLIGLDCSGFVQTLLRTIGEDPLGDQNAQAYYEHFKKTGISSVASSGALAFYGSGPTTIGHVAFFLNPHQVIEAAGGDATTDSLEKARAKMACVRIRPYNYRNDLVDILLPKYPDWVTKGIL